MNTGRGRHAVLFGLAFACLAGLGVAGLLRWSASAESVAWWSGARVNAYEQRLGRIAAWARVGLGPADVYPDVTLPPALDGLVTHGRIEAIVMADGQVVLLVQFYDINLSSGSTGVVFADPPLRPGQLRAAADVRQTIAMHGIWSTALARQITPKLYRAELDEEPQ